jgi:hypothetical protein
MMDYQEQRLIDAGRSIDLKRLRSLVVVVIEGAKQVFGGERTATGRRHPDPRRSTTVSS